MIIHSIKWRLQLWHGFLLTLLVSGLLTGFFHFERRARLEAVDAELRESLSTLLPRFAPPRSPARPPRGPVEPDRRPLGPEPTPPPPFPEEADGERGEVEPIRNGRMYFIAWDRMGNRVAATTNAPPELERPLGRRPAGRGEARVRQARREVIQWIPTGRCVLIGTSLEPVMAELRQLAVALVGLGLAIVGLGFAIGWWLASRSLRPIADIGRAAHEIAGGDLSQRINASETESELGQLIAVLNSTFDRLERAFAQQRQFTSDAAHELRTPVSVILTQTQSALARSRSPDEYRETLEACERAAGRMKRLIESLLQLARFDAGQETVQRIQFDLAAKARECVEWIQPLATEKEVTISEELPPTDCLGDPERLSQVISNLLTNAITYNRPGGSVWVRCLTDAGGILLTVSDTGHGITSEDAEHIFKRFYRADAARSGNAGNAGLGLAICNSIVAAHGGTLEFTSEPGHGTTFTLRLPDLPDAEPSE